MNASFGAVSGVVVDVTQSGAAPTALAATQPAGNAGAVTPSNFSDNVVPVHGVGVGVAVGAGVGVAVGAGVGVAVGAGVGVAVGAGVGVAVGAGVGVAVCIGGAVGVGPVMVMRPLF